MTAVQVDIATVDPDAIRGIVAYVGGVWLALIVLGLPAQFLLGLAAKTANRARRIASCIGAVIVVLAAAAIVDVVVYPYDGNASHTLVLFVTILIFSVPAELLFFLAGFRLRRIWLRTAAFAGGALLTIVGVMAFGLRALTYGFQHSLGGWP